ncbi:MAG: hypothetical protein PHP93_04290, partial [Kiritimatiellales bacterium]|nr:hypothetical protein [Kiritimatiellales bacterium]
MKLLKYLSLLAVVLIGQLPLQGKELAGTLDVSKMSDAEIAAMLSIPSKTLELKVDGNKLINTKGDEVCLQGVNVCSLEWSERGEHIPQSVKVAIDDWNANVIRLPVHDDFWFGRGKPPNSSSNDAEAYR